MFTLNRTPWAWPIAILEVEREPQCNMHSAVMAYAISMTLQLHTIFSHH